MATAFNSGTNGDDSSVERAAAGMAHDMGKLAYVIEARARRLRARVRDEAVDRDAEWIERCAAELRVHLRTFIERCRASAEPGKPEDAAVEDALATVLAVAGGTHGEDRINLAVADSIPPLACGRRDLERVLINLLDNALAASVNGTSVDVEVSAEGRWLRVVVSDRGPGIPDELLERVFDPFFTTRREGGGTGLGLVVCRDTVRSLAGSLELTRRRGGGTRAELSIPILDVGSLAHGR